MFIIIKLILYRQEKLNTDTIFLKTTKQKVWSRNQCKNMLPQLDEGFICGTGDRKAKDFGYAAVWVSSFPPFKTVISLKFLRLITYLGNISSTYTMYTINFPI